MSPRRCGPPVRQSGIKYGPRAGAAGQGKHVGNMQAGPWTSWGARVSLPSIRVQKGYVGLPAGGRAARASLLDYTQWEFTVAVSRVSEAGRIGRVKRAGIRREPAARVAGIPCVTLGVVVRRIRRRARGGVGRPCVTLGL